MMEQYGSLYVVVVLICTLITTVSARYKYPEPCLGREEYITLGIIISVIWPIGVPLFLVFLFLDKVSKLLYYLWSIKL